ncbi:MAG: hypothetical protein H0U03_05510 [Actinobacteria bacterium]|nr:hypothetical protein [Actinomycetota bacterium]
MTAARVRRSIVLTLTVMAAVAGLHAGYERLDTNYGHLEDGAIVACAIVVLMVAAMMTPPPPEVRRPLPPAPLRVSKDAPSPAELVAGRTSPTWLNRFRN